ncbi:MAG: ribbon-helix-helix protein, CopG family [Acidobacteria bacterium]|nr:ribbon-helix-helix protein, CopG family [Acidobacteriota bacterium]
MKPIQVMFDEALLKRLDADEEVRQVGRSAVLRRAAADYLRRRKAKTTAEAYKRAYGPRRAALDQALTDWPEENTWPEQ